MLQNSHLLGFEVILRCSEDFVAAHARIRAVIVAFRIEPHSANKLPASGFFGASCGMPFVGGLIERVVSCKQRLIMTLVRLFGVVMQLALRDMLGV